MIIEEIVPPPCRPEKPQSGEKCKILSIHTYMYEEVMSMPYAPIPLRQEITVEEIYTIHYFEYRSDFRFPGESHDFWEFCYVDKGEVLITMDEQECVLRNGDIVFHKPKEFHSVAATGTSAPNLVVISFQCVGEAMRFFDNKILHVDNAERNLLAQIILEAKNCFAHRLDDPYQTKIVKKNSVPFGAEQFLQFIFRAVSPAHCTAEYHSRRKRLNALKNLQK